MVLAYRSGVQGTAKAKVLVAAAPELDERIRECLPGQEVLFVHTMHEAVGALRQDGFSLLVIELGFDDSRMFELLQHVRALPRYSEAPVVCVYADHLNLTETVIRDIDVAVKALGGKAFLDLRDGSLAYPDDCSALERTAERSAALRPN